VYIAVLQLLVKLRPISRTSFGHESDVNTHVNKTVTDFFGGYIPIYPVATPLAIVKFLVHLLGKGKERGEMGKGDVGEENGERTGRVWKCRKWECTKKIAPKYNKLGIWRRPLGLPPRVMHF